ncbi:MAG: hypothetical protein ACRDZM_05470 [Acidimicrobiia bacterium]
MLPIATYEMVRKLNEERRERSMRKFWWRHVDSGSETTLSPWLRDAEVIELAFGTHCDAEEPLGA